MLRTMAAMLIVALSIARGVGAPGAALAAEAAVVIPAPALDNPRGPGPAQTAVIAGGCFWGVQGVYQHVRGVQQVLSGYAGGTKATADYEAVSRGDTGHAEAVEVVFDPSKISYEDILGYFFRMHDPTTPNRQGNDVGTSYRSAIFYHDEEQKKVAERVKEQVNRSGKWKNPVVTEIVPAPEFYDAEEYHQKYLVKNPGGYTCHYLRN